jgi:acyl-CoA thioesterase
MTVALRALVAEIADPDLHLVSATATFCAPVPAAPVQVRAVVLRRGNAAVQARAALSFGSGEAELGMEVSATFLRERTFMELVGARPPVVPAPSEAAPMEPHGRASVRGVPAFFGNLETRAALGTPWWEGGGPPGAEAELARWHRYRVPQQLPGGLLDPLSLPPLADTMPPSVAQGLGPTAPRFHAPSLDLTVHFFDPTPRDWILVHSRARRARAGYAGAEAELWDDEGRLLAYATQTMMLRRRGPQR